MADTSYRMLDPQSDRETLVACPACAKCALCLEARMVLPAVASRYKRERGG